VHPSRQQAACQRRYHAALDIENGRYLFGIQAGQTAGHPVPPDDIEASPEGRVVEDECEDQIQHNQYDDLQWYNAEQLAGAQGDEGLVLHRDGPAFAEQISRSLADRRHGQSRDKWLQIK
jgi:hypothetical protein